MFKKTFAKKSFTLIEIIQVIVIIGILAAIAYPKFLNYRQEAQIARDQGVLAALRSASYLYFVQNATQTDHPQYPPNINALAALVHWDPPDLACKYNWDYFNGTTDKPSFCP